MEIKITFLRDNSSETISLEDSSTVLTLLEKIKKDPDTLVILRKGTPIPLDAPLQDGDDLTLVIVTSGG
ncbi:MAG: MoaD/ThiS family protein [Candidatus Thermoplasmatota archaeon]|nr:MoaD/ThiS family protein [Candidatus Thermoplasmatota archaeon]